MKNLLLLFVLLLPGLAFGQDSLTFAPMSNVRPVVVDQGVVLKLAPLSLIDIDPTVQAAVEIPLRPNWSIQQEVGYGWPKLGLVGSQRDFTAKGKSTFRARTEIRYYFSPGFRQQAALKPGPGGFYVAGEALYKQMNHARTITAPQTVTNGVILTQPTTAGSTARLLRQVYGMHAKIGYQTVVSRSGKTPQFVVDVFVGVGFRIVSVRQTSGPPISSNGFVDNTGFISFGGVRSRFDPTNDLLRKPSLSGGLKSAG